MLFRPAIRIFTKHPGFAALAAGSLASGIGLAAALASVADAILFRPLSAAQPSEIARVYTASRLQPLGYVSYPDYEDLSRNSRTLAAMVAQSQVLLAVGTGAGESPQVRMGLAVTPNYFDVLGVRAALGRTFRGEDARVAVVVLSSGFWRSHYGGDRRILGRAVEIGGAPFTVIGVAPPGFGLDRFVREDYYIPIGVYGTGLLPSAGNPLTDRTKRYLSVFARRAAPIAAVQAELNSLTARLEAEYPDADRGRRTLVLSERSKGLEWAHSGEVLLSACFYRSYGKLKKGRVLMIVNGWRLYRRHKKTCKPGNRKGRDSENDCQCMIYRDKWENGVRTNVPTGFRDMNRAAVETYGYATQEPAAPAGAARLTVAAAIEQYLVKRRAELEPSSFAAMTSTLTRFGDFCQKPPADMKEPIIFVDQVNGPTFTGYRAVRLGKVSPASVAKELKHLRTLWKWVQETYDADQLPKKMVPVSAFAPPKQKSKEQKVGFTNAQLAAVKAAIPGSPDPIMMKALVQVLLHTGLACADVADLRRDSIIPCQCHDGEPGCGQFETDRIKTEVPIRQTIPAEVMQALAALPHPLRAYFFREDTVKDTSARDKVRGVVNALLVRAGVRTESIGKKCKGHRLPPEGSPCPVCGYVPPTGGSVHIFRHTTARLLQDLIRAGKISEADAAAHMGHSVAMFRAAYSGVDTDTRKRRDAIRLAF